MALCSDEVIISLLRLIVGPLQPVGSGVEGGAVEARAVFGWARQANSVALELNNKNVANDRIIAKL
jgi:hypothetical protein